MNDWMYSVNHGVNSWSSSTIKVVKSNLKHVKVKVYNCNFGTLARVEQVERLFIFNIATRCFNVGWLLQVVFEAVYGFKANGKLAMSGRRYFPRTFFGQRIGKSSILRCLSEWNRFNVQKWRLWLLLLLRSRVFERWAANDSHQRRQARRLSCCCHEITITILCETRLFWRWNSLEHSIKCDETALKHGYFLS